MTTTQTKTCTKCCQTKPLTEYYRKGNRLRSECKHCSYKSCKAYKSRPEIAARIRRLEKGRGQRRKTYLIVYRLRNAEEIRQKDRERYNRKARPVYFNTCQQTGKLFTARRSTTKYSDEGRLIRSREVRDVQKEVQRGRAIQEHNQKEIQFTCSCCGCVFTPAYGDKHRSYCSSECARAANKQREKTIGKYRAKARRYGVAFEPVTAAEVMARADYRCELCHKPTPVEKRQTHEHDGPVVNHIVPLSKGGGHTLGNLRLLCRGCSTEISRTRHHN